MGHDYHYITGPDQELLFRKCSHCGLVENYLGNERYEEVNRGEVCRLALAFCEDRLCEVPP